MKARQAAANIFTLLLVLLWMYTASSKLFTFRIFRGQLRKSPLFTEFPGTAAIIIPIVEIGLVVMLINESTKRLGLKLSAALLSIFTLYLVGMLSFSENIPCSCGGVLQNMTWTQHVFFNIGFILIALAALYLTRKQVQGRNTNLRSAQLNS